MARVFFCTHWRTSTYESCNSLCSGKSWILGWCLFQSLFQSLSGTPTEWQRLPSTSPCISLHVPDSFTKIITQCAEILTCYGFIQIILIIQCPAIRPRSAISDPILSLKCKGSHYQNEPPCKLPCIPFLVD